MRTTRLTSPGRLAGLVVVGTVLLQTSSLNELVMGFIVCLKTQLQGHYHTTFLKAKGHRVLQMASGLVLIIGQWAFHQLRVPLSL